MARAVTNADRMNIKANLNYLALAQQWANYLGERPESLVRLSGGINNIVYRCGNSQGKQWVIKIYPSHAPDNHDRMQAEIEFLKFASITAPGYTPNLIEEDQTGRCIVMEYLRGKTFSPGEKPPESAIGSALEFFRMLNSEPWNQNHMVGIDAGEGFLAISEHLENVRERLKSLQTSHLPTGVRLNAERLLMLAGDRFKRVCERTYRGIENGQIKDRIESTQRRISPSDFGFHNAILTRSGIRFFDFEFAGWDDPAKAAIDFTLQPRVPINKKVHQIVSGFAMGDDDEVKVRCVALEPVLRLKWLCIVLRILQPSKLAVMQGLSPEMISLDLLNSRLQKALSYLESHDELE